MQGQPTVVAALNECLSNELITINQSFLHARMYRNWGLPGLNEPVYKESIQAMKRADDLIERILFLQGLPNLQHLGKLQIGENTSEMMACDLDLAKRCADTLRKHIDTCEQSQDYVSRALLSTLLGGVEDYYDWLETQQELIQSMTLANYLQSQA